MTDATDVRSRDEYAFGHSADEQRRLDRQGAFLRPATERWLREAGIAPGMRVLDVGCGTGDLTRLAAEFVGTDGRVLGVDRSPEVIATARRSAEARQLTTVEFAEADINEFDTNERFDALIGRLVLMYQPDPAATVRHLAKLIRPGGIVAFTDYYFSFPVASPPLPLVAKTFDWVVTTIRRATPNADLGARLHRVYAEAGMPAPAIRFEALAGFGGDAAFCEMLVGVARTLLPVAARLGVVSAAEVEIDTLLARLMAETTAANGVAFGPTFAMAATRLPAPV